MSRETMNEAENENHSVAMGGPGECARPFAPFTTRGASTWPFVPFVIIMSSSPSEGGRIICDAEGDGDGDGDGEASV